MYFLVKLTMKGQVKTSNVVFQNVGTFLWIWHHTLNLLLVISQLHISYHGTERFLQHLDDLVRSIFSVRDKNTVSSSELSAS